VVRFPITPVNMKPCGDENKKLDLLVGGKTL